MRATSSLILVCVLVSILCWVEPSSLIFEHMVYTGNGLKEGALWRPVTALFVHFDIFHLIGNMIFLYVFGSVVEEDAGRRMTAIAFLVGGVASFTVSSFYYGFDVPMIGASGAIFALSAAAIFVKPLKLSGFFLFVPLGLVAILYFIFNVLAVGLGLRGSVGYVAHVVGFVVGVPFGIVFSKGKWVKNLGITIMLLIAFLILVYVVQSLALFAF